MKTKKKRFTAFWSKDEIGLLKNEVYWYKKSGVVSSISWEMIANLINKVFHNNRTPKACEHRYFKLKPNAFDRRWSKKEIEVLLRYGSEGIRGHKFPPSGERWNFVAYHLNSRFKRNRTSHGCKQKYYDTIRQQQKQQTKIIVRTVMFKPRGGCFTTSPEISQLKR